MTRRPRAAPDAAEALCLGCGLCCDGSLFWAVELAPGDELPTEPPGGRLPQPCPYYGIAGCTIYAARPAQCRAFRCRVLDAVAQGKRDMAWGQARIDAMRHLLAGLDDALPGEGALYVRAAQYLESPASLPDDARIRARIAVYREMIGDFRALTDEPGA
ncbi:MAG: hypothetical protein CSA74_04035 [Rhodobacterales bacterium]|nr:MAG: hypothetical protein CSA74_04035 [Rhodobacterales bacterium]